MFATHEHRCMRVRKLLRALLCFDGAHARERAPCVCFCSHVHVHAMCTYAGERVIGMFARCWSRQIFPETLARASARLHARRARYRESGAQTTAHTHIQYGVNIMLAASAHRSCTGVAMVRKENTYFLFGRVCVCVCCVWCARRMHPYGSTVF